jgi:flagellar biosynthesis anti-sigma factor FlgM
MVKVNINNLHGNDAVQATKNARAEKTESKIVDSKGKTHVKNDSVEVSSRGAEVGKLVDDIKQLPDVRQTMVNELKQRIASGDYDPSSGDIAGAIIKDEK